MGQLDFSDLINLTQAARYLGVSYMTIHRWKARGKIKVTYLLGHPYASLKELMRLKGGVSRGCRRNASRKSG